MCSIIRRQIDFEPALKVMRTGVATLNNIFHESSI